LNSRTLWRLRRQPVAVPLLELLQAHVGPFRLRRRLCCSHCFDPMASYQKTVKNHWTLKAKIRLIITRWTYSRDRANCLKRKASAVEHKKHRLKMGIYRWNKFQKLT
jgi:hypothetical protein